MNVKGLIGQILWRVIQSRLFSPVRPRIIHTRPFLMKGKTKANLDLSILVFAHYENIVHYVAKIAYPEEPYVAALEKTTYHKIPQIIAETEPDIVVAEFDDTFSAFFSKEFLILPRVNFSLDISLPLKEVIAKMMRVRRRNIQKIESLPFTYEVTRNYNKFKLFYDEIYLPFTSKTAKADFARVTPASTAEEWFLKGELLFVKSNDTCLAGLLYHPENSTMHCRLIAYTEGIAGQAALYRLIKIAKEKGYTKVNYGETSPFINDGLFFYKKSWGMEMKLRIKEAKILAIKLCNSGRAAHDFLVDNSFIFTDFKSLIGLVLTHSIDMDIPSFCQKYYTPGLHKLMVLYPAKNAVAPCKPHLVAPKSVDFLKKLASEMDLVTCLHDFSV